MYLTQDQTMLLTLLLKTFFTLPYSTDLSGKDAETLLRIVKGIQGERSRKKELFDLIDRDRGVGYSIKTLGKSATATRVDVQEQRLCDVEEIRELRARGPDTAPEQGDLLLTYMRRRIKTQMEARGVRTAKSLILLKRWDRSKTRFGLRYWEEDFEGYIDDLIARNEQGTIQWVELEAGLHGRDKSRKNKAGENVRLIRVHYKHNQIFTDHDVPEDAVEIEFTVNPISWQSLATILQIR